MDSVFPTLEKICAATDSLRLLCVGDIMLDRFVYGRVSRISPEAPIPVLQQTQVKTMLGAVGNVARNVTSLGGEAVVISLVGEDAESAELEMLLKEDQRLYGQLQNSPDRKTTVKIRYISAGQQLLRVDNEEVSAPTPEQEDRLIEKIREAAGSCHAFLISDYAKGVVTDRVIEACRKEATRYSVPVIVDPKGSDFVRYGAVDLIKPNVTELSAVIGTKLYTDEDVEAGLLKALKILPAKAILLTRSDKGLSFATREGEIRHYPAEKREVFDVSGAGDTSLTALGLALASGSSLDAAARFALIASGIAVSKAGTATVSVEEVHKAIRDKQRSFRVTDVAGKPIEELVASWKAEGLSVGFTNGCFDILHAGHLSVLEYAASHCDRLIVGLNSDESVAKLKGPGRPVNSEADRARLLTGLKPVDRVIVFGEDTPFELIKAIRPDVLVKGGDYTPETVVGADIVMAEGGKVLIAPTLEGRSTTRIIEKSRSS